ncbi:hypothetical protein LCGC14_0538580 [marine sediment metagenome]|uniref:Uncharacterized protein n=1 Tax=marine sediment metagenome TaxID=412755 RepID=A0A0F9V1P7_9ZZZZ
MTETVLTDPPVVADPWAGVAKELRYSGDGNDRLACFGNDTAKAGTSYLELMKQQSTSVKIPDEHTSAPERSAFYQSIGCPRDPTGYEIERPTLPEGMTYSEEFEMTMRGISHEAGISQAQIKVLTKAFNEYQISTHNKDATEAARINDAQDLALKEKKGGDYDKFCAVVERGFVELIPSEELRTQFAQLIEEKGLKNHPIFTEVWGTVSEKLLDDTLVRGNLPVDDKDYKPASPNSPEMYKNPESEPDQKAHDWFVARGHVY